MKLQSNFRAAKSLKDPKWAFCTKSDKNFVKNLALYARTHFCWYNDVTVMLVALRACSRYQNRAGYFFKHKTFSKISQLSYIKLTYVIKWRIFCDHHRKRQNRTLHLYGLFICSGSQLPSARRQGLFGYPKQSATVSVGSVLKWRSEHSRWMQGAASPLHRRTANAPVIRSGNGHLSRHGPPPELNNVVYTI
jgi:hypothetical protein